MHVRPDCGVRSPECLHRCWSGENLSSTHQAISSFRFILFVAGHCRFFDGRGLLTQVLDRVLGGLFTRERFRAGFRSKRSSFPQWHYAFIITHDILWYLLGVGVEHFDDASDGLRDARNRRLPKPCLSVRLPTVPTADGWTWTCNSRARFWSA